MWSNLVYDSVCRLMKIHEEPIFIVIVTCIVIPSKHCGARPIACIQRPCVMNPIIAFTMLLFSAAALGQGTLLVANKNESTLSVLSLAGKVEVAKIEVGKGPHEVAVSPDGNIIAVANYGNKSIVANSLTIIDLSRKKKIKEISLAEFTRPHGIEFFSQDGVLVTSESTKTLIKVNVVTDEIALVARTDQFVSHMVAYSPRDHLAYVANVVSGTVSMIDVKESKLLRQLPFRKGIEGISVSPDGEEVWVANREDSTVTAMSTKSLEILAIMPAHQVAYRIKHLKNGRYVAVSNGMSGSLSIYDAKKKKLIKDVDLKDSTRKNTAEEPNMPVPVGIATSHDSRYVFVSMAGYDKVAIINTKNWNVEETIVTGDGPDGIYYSPIDID